MIRRAIAALALIAVGVALWLLLRDGDPPVPADRRGAAVHELVIESEAVGEDLPVSVVVPAGSDRDAPLLVFLHGRGGDEDSYLNDPMFSALADLGHDAPVVAFPYGGEGSYWHDRDDGAWGEYVTEEVIPEPRSFPANQDRVAIGGISMGGFGAYDIARLNPERFCAVGGHSPALWQTAAETAPGAFDDAEDFAAHDVIASASDPDAYAEVPIWLDAGGDDPFLPGDEAFSAALESTGVELTEKRWPGGHDSDYWDAHWESYLGFYAAALEDC